MGGERLLNQALNYTLKLAVVKAAAGTLARLREVTRAPDENAASNCRASQGWTTGMWEV